MKFSSEQNKRYSRHFILREIGIVGQQKLINSKALIIGAGGLGSFVISELAAAGVGKLDIVDCDDVEMSNLQRQIIHSTQSLGVNKAVSAAEFVKRLNPDVNVNASSERFAPSNALDMVEGYDVVLDCVDNMGIKMLINDACVLKKVPFVHAGVVGVKGQVMSYKPGTACLRCVMDEVPHDCETCADLGVLGCAVGVIGSIQAAEAVKIIVGFGEPLVNKALFFDCTEMRSKVLKFDKNDDCAVCGTHPSIVDPNGGDYE